ncbi:carbamoyltransferase HypF [Synechocystis sp. LKSZ1]|uniref:carbamoyltransferase HypF n=1 Tax=Synechocystis sp. LKSZ1 TaxID=3144951 RepID=UPI00336BF01E
MTAQHLRVTVQGKVQGVGFRPFAYRLAKGLGVNGWVQNSSRGAVLSLEADALILAEFLERLRTQLPPPGQIEDWEIETYPLVHFTQFEIRASVPGPKTATILPDLATCPACLVDIFDPQNRRYRYPFTNCTHCGPRYSIIEGLPYDRGATSMRAFPLCPACEQEYRDPGNRRFHAQPNACPACGPQIELWDTTGQVIAQKQEALTKTLEALQAGKIVAIKGLGGFQLWVDAHQEGAVQRLRQRKHRPAKPLAVMYPQLNQIAEDCDVGQEEADLLTSPAAPIVLLRKKSNFSLAPSLAPNNPELGAMLPCTPLHHLLLKDYGGPVVATSGNVAGEPICIENAEALQRLSAIADLFLVHNRPIVRPVDDSVVRVIQGQPLMIRRSRGYAPLPLTLPQALPSPTLAVGGQLKNTLAIAMGNQAYLSQHIGDLDTPASYQTFENTLTSLAQLYDFQPQVIVHDGHPDYLSTQYAARCPQPKLAVQHHYAHALAVMAEHHLAPPVLAVTWDGTGYGLDGTIWGGEFLRLKNSSWQRVAHLAPFPLLGGEQAIKDPRRIALALCSGQDFPTSLAQAFSTQDLKNLDALQIQPYLCPLTSSVGRLFDGVSALLGLCQTVTFEGQAAMALAAAVEEDLPSEAYPFDLEGTDSQLIHWRPMLRAILQDLQSGVSATEIATRFHHTLVAMLVAVAQSQRTPQIVLGGGCFQNRFLLEQSIIGLRQAGFEVYWPRLVPPNDGGLALGQLWALHYRQGPALAKHSPEGQ